jgi:hypothetical protein
VSYCIDTSCLIAAWEERYPIENFPKFWTLLDKAIADGKIVAPEAVLDETEPKSAELHAWLKERDTMFVPLEEAVQVQVKKQRFAADPFVIATAVVQKRVIITEEKPTGSLKRPNIPDVCGDLGVDYISLLQLIRAEKWVIG